MLTLVPPRQPIWATHVLKIKTENVLNAHVLTHDILRTLELGRSWCGYRIPAPKARELSLSSAPIVVPQETIFCVVAEGEADIQEFESRSNYVVEAKLWLNTVIPQVMKDKAGEGKIVYKRRGKIITLPR